MNIQLKNRFVAIIAGACLALCCAAAAAPKAGDAEATSRVTVTYVNPHAFSEYKQFGQEDRFNGSDYLQPLKAHLIKRAARMLPPGDRLDVRITDVKLAGAYEPWRGPRTRYIRFMTDNYPPRIDLDFKLTGPDGKIIREGSRKLRNLGYLTSGPTFPGDSEALRYDKALLDSWLRRGPDKL